MLFLALPGRQLMHVGQTRRGPVLLDECDDLPRLDLLLDPRFKPVRTRTRWFVPGLECRVIARVTGVASGVALGTTPGMPTSNQRLSHDSVLAHMPLEVSKFLFNKDKKRLWRNNKMQAMDDGIGWVSSTVKVALCAWSPSGSVGVGGSLAGMRLLQRRLQLCWNAGTSMSETVLRPLAFALNGRLAHLSYYIKRIYKREKKKKKKGNVVVVVGYCCTMILLDIIILFYTHTTIFYQWFFYDNMIIIYNSYYICSAVLK